MTRTSKPAKERAVKRKVDKHERAVDRMWNVPQSLAVLRLKWIADRRRVAKAEYVRGLQQGHDDSLPRPRKNPESR